MAYSELIKDFNRIRAYLRSFYVYGFRHRGEFTQKSPRSYDNERRRVESWLGDYMSFGQDEDGRRVFLSVDSRAVPANPLYRAFRTKSFTARDITLHFHLLDILAAGSLPITGIMNKLTKRLSEFGEEDIPDESTVRKKLKEYLSLGLIDADNRGRSKYYKLADHPVDIGTWDAAAAYFSEAMPLGVIGSFIQDRLPKKFTKFRYKHHYILNALDSESLYTLLTAIGEKRFVTFNVRKQRETVLPLKVYVGTQTGRQYLLVWVPEGEQDAGCIEDAANAGQSAGAKTSASGRFSFYRADLIDHVRTGEVFEFPEDLQKKREEFSAHTWGVAGNSSDRLEHIEMTICVAPGESHIVERLEREKRCGKVEKLENGISCAAEDGSEQEKHERTPDDNELSYWRFSADVYDALEMMPWIRTFTGRVVDLKCTDDRVTDRFREDTEELARMYGGEQHAVS